MNSDHATLDNEEMLQGADAQINLARGTVVTNARIEAMPEDVAKVAALRLIWRLQYECI